MIKSPRVNEPIRGVGLLVCLKHQDQFTHLRCFRRFIRFTILNKGIMPVYGVHAWQVSHIGVDGSSITKPSPFYFYAYIRTCHTFVGNRTRMVFYRYIYILAGRMLPVMSRTMRWWMTRYSYNPYWYRREDRLHRVHWHRSWRRYNRVELCRGGEVVIPRRTCGWLTH